MTSYAQLPGLAWLRRYDEGPAWLEGLDDAVARSVDRWGLTVGAPFEQSHVSLALPVTRAAGEAAVLKIEFPDVESECAADALEAWDGDGAVRLLDADRESRALLIERCEPGTPLSALAPEDALDVMVDLLPRLWRPAGPPFRTVAAEARRWAASLPERWRAAAEPFPRRCLELGLELLDELPRTQGEPVLVHQDLHGDNVLRAVRRPWLAIDPKPLLAEREFSLVPVIRSDELGEGRDLLVRRLDRLSGALGLDRTRAASWALAHTVAWNADGGGRPGHLAAIGWLYEVLAAG